jgi:ABC-2 type transport system permease protein
LRLDVPEGYYGFLAGYLMLMACIYAALAGAQILSKEINKKTAETTFTLPVTRRHIITMKLLAAGINCAVLTAVIFTGSVVTFAAPEMNPEFTGRISLYMLFILLMQLLFMLAGLLISVLIKSHKRAGTMIASFTIGAYFISFIANLGSKTAFLRYFTPFEYFPSVDVINGKSLESFGLIIAPVLILTFWGLSYGLVAKKDI